MNKKLIGSIICAVGLLFSTSTIPHNAEAASKVATTNSNGIKVLGKIQKNQGKVTLKDGRTLTYQGSKLTLKKGTKVVWTRDFSGSGTNEIFDIKISSSCIFVLTDMAEYNQHANYQANVINLNSGKDISVVKLSDYYGSDFEISQWKDKTLLAINNTLYDQNGAHSVSNLYMYNGQGVLQWKKQLDFEKQPVINYLSDGTIIITSYKTTTSTGTVYAIDQNGKAKWEYTDPNGLYLHNQLSFNGDNTLISARGNSSDAYIIALNKNGKKMWKTQLPSIFDYVKFTKQLNDGTIVFSNVSTSWDTTTASSCYYYNLVGINANGKVLWNKSFLADQGYDSFQTDANNIYISMPLINNGKAEYEFHVYRSNGDLVYKIQNCPYYIQQITDFKNMYATGNLVHYYQKYANLTGNLYNLKLPSVPVKK